jgi:hypothetical protein
LQKFDHDVRFTEKRKFFRRKLAQIAENWPKSPKIVILTSTPDRHWTARFSAAVINSDENCKTVQILEPQKMKFSDWQVSTSPPSKNLHRSAIEIAGF